MSLSFYSQNWHRVGGLKLTLRQHVMLHRHVYRGEVWYLLQDQATGTVHRFDAHTYSVIALLDGRRSLQEVWELACARLGDDMPTQDEVLQLVAKLHRANALRGEIPPDIDELVTRKRETRRKKLIQQLKSPLGIRIPLVDPERFLHATRGFGNVLFSRWGLYVWLIVVGAALLIAALNWSTLTNNLSDQLISLENLTVIWLVYPLIKLLHELGHGYAVKRWGGEVHEMGVMLLVFIPIPYVDASAASAFEARHQRALVGAAGILVEVFIAALALIFWAISEPGAARAVAFNTVIVGGVSTVLFNGNPLLRFDAYYVLCDLLESPNLGSRGNRYLAYLGKRFVLGIKDASAPHTGKGEAGWLAGYALISFVYRIFIMVAIVLVVASRYFFIGIVLALWSAFGVFLAPLWKSVQAAINDGQIRARPKRSIATALGLLLVTLWFVLLLPVPLDTAAEGVVMTSDDGQLIASGTGFVERIEVAANARVTSGQALISAQDPRLTADEEVLQASVNEARARAMAAHDDRPQREVIEAEILYLEAELTRLKEQQNLLAFRAPRDGTLVLPGAEDLVGSFVTRGQTLGYVIAPDALHIRVPLSQDDFELVGRKGTTASVRLASDPGVAYAAQVIQQTPAASRMLPSPVLTVDGGGRIARDPAETQEVLAVENYFELRLSAPAAALPWLHERVHVLFQHPAEALGERWYRGLRRLFLRRFDL